MGKVAHATAHHQSGELSHANPDEARRCRTQRSPAPRRRCPGKRCPGKRRPGKRRERGRHEPQRPGQPLRPRGPSRRHRLQLEPTLASFAKGIETGVSTLELDLQITKDGHEVITHDRKISGREVPGYGSCHAERPTVPLRGQIHQGPDVRAGPQPGLRHPHAAPVPGPGGLAGDKCPRWPRSSPWRTPAPRQPGEVQHRNQGRGRGAAGNGPAGAVRRRRAPRNQGRPHAEPSLNREFRLGATAPGPAARSPDPHRGPDQQGLPPGRPARQVAVARQHRRR